MAVKVNCIEVLSVYILLSSYGAASNNIGYFWQLTDVHYDANYTDHAYNKTTKLCIGEFGDYKCDSPWPLVESAIEAMKDLRNDVDFILWTGDNVPHAPDTELNGAKVYTLVKNVTNALKKTFPKTRIFPVLGNHDVWPANEVPITANDYFNQILTNSGWNSFLTDSAVATFKQGGYYVEDLGPWRIFGLNTVVWYNRDKKSASASDPGNQSLWLNKNLFEALNGGKKVLIAGHVPPGFMGRATGVEWFYDKFNSEFHKVLSDYSAAISATIFGHEHTDSFRVVYNDKGSPAVSMFLAPAVTPWKSSIPGIGANNPSLRLYKYNNSTGEVLDYSQYFLDLSKTKTGEKPKWEIEYSLKETLTGTDVSPASLHKLLTEFAEEGNGKFDQYYKFNSVSYDSTTKCEGKCKISQLCAISCIDKALYQKCINQTVYSPVCGVPKGLLTYPNLLAMNIPDQSKAEMPYYLIGSLVVIAIVLAFLFMQFYTRRKHRPASPVSTDPALVPLMA